MINVLQLSNVYVITAAALFLLPRPLDDPCILRILGSSEPHPLITFADDSLLQTAWLP